MSDANSPHPLKILFVTGRLAEPALRRVVSELAPAVGFEPEVAVLPISVAALMPTRWIARHLAVPEGTGRVVLPGLCQGDLAPLEEKAAESGSSASFERGPSDLRDLPRFFGQDRDRLAGYGAYDIEILAEINHAPRLSTAELLARAEVFRSRGADRIDLGCDPGGPWPGVFNAVRALTGSGFRVSIDSFDPLEVSDAVRAGADLVLSVNASNRHRAPDWGVEVVAIPDSPGSIDGLDASVEYLESHNVPYRLDPILEPIGFGFSASLGRYLETRRRYPQAEMLMGVGNLTELTDVDSSGVNVLLSGFCQELGIRSVLTTAVIPWARSSVRELDLARRLVHFAVQNRVLPKRVEPRLVSLRDPDIPDEYGPEALAELASRIKDPNWRLFAEDGRLIAINGSHHLSDPDPFTLFEQMDVADPSHAFYLGYELAKAKTALTLSKAYRQDQALSWGHLTEPEISHRAKKR